MYTVQQVLIYDKIKIKLINKHFTHPKKSIRYLILNGAANRATLKNSNFKYQKIKSKEHYVRITY